MRWRKYSNCASPAPMISELNEDTVRFTFHDSSVIPVNLQQCALRKLQAGLERQPRYGFGVLQIVLLCNNERLDVAVKECFAIGRG